VVLALYATPTRQRQTGKGRTIVRRFAAKGFGSGPVVAGPAARLGTAVAKTGQVARKAKDRRCVVFMLPKGV